MQGRAGWRRVQGLERHPLPRVDQSQRRLCSYGMYGYGLRTDGRLDPKTYAYVDDEDAVIALFEGGLTLIFLTTFFSPSKKNGGTFQF